MWRQLRAIGPLPGMATLVVPALITWATGEVDVGWWSALGAPPIAAGLLLFVSTVRLFAGVGQGTLAPWDPPSRLVVEGPYRHVRHPMITGVLCVLLGEAAVLGSLPLLAWAGAFLAVNAVYLPLVEEPRLVRRFGADYEAYQARVPRFVPRIRPA